MKEQSLYEVLGVAADASSADIRRRYLMLVREYPPETHPEEFERVRQAYEVLYDPERRQTYDAGPHVKPGDMGLEPNIQHLVETRQWKKLLSAVKQVDEPFRSTLQSTAYFFQGRWDSHVRARERVLKIMTQNGDISSLAMVLQQWQDLYTHESDADRTQEALALYDRFRTKDGLWRQIWPDYAHILSHMGRKRDIVPLMEPILPDASAAFSPEDGELIASWVVYLFTTGLVDLGKRYRTRAARYWRRADTDTIAAYKQILGDHVEDWIDDELLEVAREVAEFVALIDPKDRAANDRLHYLDDALTVQKELQRMANDTRLNPLVGRDATSLFLDEMGWSDPEYDAFGDEEPTSMDQREWYVEGVSRLKKTYPATYRMFRDDWQERLEALTAGMNREQRRRLLR